MCYTYINTGTYTQHKKKQILKILAPSRKYFMEQVREAGNEKLGVEIAVCGVSVSRRGMGLILLIV